MKKMTALILALALAFGLCACSSKGGGEKTVAPAGPAEDEGNAAEAKDGEPIKIALICPTLSASTFNVLTQQGFEEAAAMYPDAIFSLAECDDSDAFADNARAFVEEGYDLIIGSCWNAGDAISAVATEFPDSAKYALINATVDTENVWCLDFAVEEGAYLIGLIAALTVDGDSHVYGSVNISQNDASWAWRYPYTQAVLSIDPDAEFVFNYVESYNDPATAKEYALQQYEQDCKFIMTVCSGGDDGVFEAALEKGFYTAGQDADRTSADNPYIVSSQIKDVSSMLVYLVDNFMNGTWNTENQMLGIDTNAVGAIYATHETDTPRSERLSDEDMEVIAQAIEDINNGKIDMTVPAEDTVQLPMH